MCREEFRKLISKALTRYSKRDLAEKLSTSMTTITFWESGQVAPSSLGRKLIMRSLTEDSSTGRAPCS